MATMKCQSCNGVYESLGPDDVPYTHACGPVTRVAIERGGVAQLVDLAAVRDTDVLTVQRNGAEVQVSVKETQPDDVRIGDVTAPRPNARNENWDPKAYPVKGVWPTKAAGLGAVAIG